MSSQTYDSDFTEVFTLDFPDLFSMGMSISRLPIVNLDLRHVYPRRAVQIFLAFRDLKCLDFLVLENPDMSMARIPMVTLVQLLSNLMADG